MDGHRIPTLVVAALLFVVPGAPRAEPRLGPSRLQAMLDDSGPTARATGRAIFDVHFAGLCWTPEALPFDRVCNHVPLEQRDDPSPWPDVFVALKGADIVAVIVPEAAWVPRTWRCRALPELEGPRMCTAPGIRRATRNDWAWRWSRLPRSAG
jgi:hypothetical protein